MVSLQEPFYLSSYYNVRIIRHLVHGLSTPAAIHDSSQPVPRKFLGIVGHDLSDSKSNRLHVDIFRFCFCSSEVNSIDSSKMIGNSPELLELQPVTFQAQPVYLLLTAGSSRAVIPTIKPSLISCWEIILLKSSYVLFEMLHMQAHYKENCLKLEMNQIALSLNRLQQEQLFLYWAHAHV